MEINQGQCAVLVTYWNNVTNQYNNNYYVKCKELKMTRLVDVVRPDLNLA